MAQLVKQKDLSKKSGMVATSFAPFEDREVEKLTAKLKKFALVFDGDFYQIFGE